MQINIIQEFVYPEGVAYKVGGPNSYQYALLEIHYDNQNSTSGETVWTVLSCMTIFVNLVIYTVRCSWQLWNDILLQQNWWKH